MGTKMKTIGVANEAFIILVELLEFSSDLNVIYCNR